MKNAEEYSRLELGSVETDSDAPAAIGTGIDQDFGSVPQGTPEEPHASLGIYHLGMRPSHVCESLLCRIIAWVIIWRRNSSETIAASAIRELDRNPSGVAVKDSDPSHCRF